jgi:hypothetical protein
MGNNLAPIVIFSYNRPRHLKMTIEYLKKNELASESGLYIYSDAAKSDKDIEKVTEVREYLKTVDSFKSLKIIERKKNFGLAKSIIDGVTTIVNQYGRVIVLEDDLITSPYFLNFMNDGLEIYKNDSKVCQIMGYSFIETYKDEFNLEDTYFIKGANCLGWATWKDSWRFLNIDSYELIATIEENKLQKSFDRDNSYNFMKMLKQQSQGKVDSWAIRWHASAFINNLYTLHPLKSLVFHTGNDGDGTNYNNITGKLDPLNVPLNTRRKINILKKEAFETKNTSMAYNKHLKRYKLAFWIRVKNKLWRILSK